ncbi:site-specific integrase [Streptomyces bathyalis]|uniref:Site-specific integrase n=1 Tax=Streptomyces bathyalis TaxID=2710756 RepID=A0A7T1T717_9ACTN|nr:site-specific integrase [Streptomyces bathyalis]QPP07562.1 site-specific integrase [Streptomyces bathyalis]
MFTYDVKIWVIRSRGSSHQVRWRVGTKEFAETFPVKASAEGRRAELLLAQRDGQQFDTETGLPRSELKSRRATETWYAHTLAYVVMKWPNVSAKHRASIADSLATVTPKLVRDSRGAPSPKALRRALFSWAYQLGQDEQGQLRPRFELGDPPEEIAEALTWIAKRSVPLTDLESTECLRNALAALELKLDGTKAAENTVNRKHPVFSNSLRYAVEREFLDRVPLYKVDWKPPKSEDEIDFRYVPGPALSRDLIEAVGRQGQRGRHLKAFFGCIYYAAMRPGEVRGLKESDCKLPSQGWGELLPDSSSPSVGSGWTDSGASFDSRGLKKRARKSVRPVPIPPVLVRLLRAQADEFGTGSEGHLFQAARGGLLLSKEYPEIWRAARVAVLSKKEAATPLADTPYSLRHAGVSLWLSSGVPPAEVARRAGHSIAVLFRFYAKAIHGQEQQANERIERALNRPDEERER